MKAVSTSLFAYIGTRLLKAHVYSSNIFCVTVNNRQFSSNVFCWWFERTAPPSDQIENLMHRGPSLLEALVQLDILLSNEFDFRQHWVGI